MKDKYGWSWYYEEKSVIYELFGDNLYSIFEDIPKRIIAISTLIICVLYALSFFCHFRLAAILFNLCSGVSPLFLAYILSVIVFIDKRRKVIKVDSKKSIKYIWFISKGIILLIFGVAAIVLTGNINKHNAFAYSEYVVDMQTGYYHYPDIGCPEIQDCDDLVLMTGEEIEETTDGMLCPWCRDYMHIAEEDYYSGKF